MRIDWVDHDLDGRVIRSSLTEAEAAELARLAEGACVVEIGSAYGFSTVHIAKAAKWVFSIDPHEALTSYEALIANLRHFEVSGRVVAACLPSSVALPLFRSGGFDLAFIDGDHTELEVIYDIEGCLRLLKPGGVLAIHDYGEISCPDVKTVVDEMGLVPTSIVDTLFVTTKGRHV